MKPVLDAVYGFRRDVTEFQTGWVLKELAASADENRLSDLVNQAFQKQSAPK